MKEENTGTNSEGQEFTFSGGIGGNAAPGEIQFHLPKEESPLISEPILKLSKEGFWYKGEKVDDVHNVYERFNEWLTKARKTDKLE